MNLQLSAALLSVECDGTNGNHDHEHANCDGNKDLDNVRGPVLQHFLLRLLRIF